MNREHNRVMLERLGEELGVEITVLESVDSTNDYAAAAALPHGAVVVAIAQTCGRGQRGTIWESRAGENLTLSIVLKPSFLPVSQQFLLSQLVSVALTDMLADHGLAAAIKWPNDIYVGDRKIAGILIENDVMGSTIGRSIVGIGLNVNQMAFDSALPNPTSMAIEAGMVFDLELVLAALYTRLTESYHKLESGGAESLRQRYDSLLYRKGRQHLYKTPGAKRFAATIEGVLPTGELILRHSDGTQSRYLFKEVEYS